VKSNDALERADAWIPHPSPDRSTVAETRPHRLAARSM
jgi:hypothetical protein